MKKQLLIFALLIIGSAARAQSSGSFQVKGDIDKYYPVTFNDGNCWQNIATELEVGRATVHTDASWRGALISKFRYHTYNYGNAANFIDVDMRSCLLANAVIDKFIAGWTDATYLNNDAKIIIWLRGGTTTYYYKANTLVNPVVYDGVQNALPFQQTNGPAHNYKTAIDSYVNTNGATLANNFSVSGDMGAGGNLGGGTNSPVFPLHVVANNNTGRASSFLWGQYYGTAIATNSTSSSNYALNVFNGMDNKGSGGQSLFYVRSDGNVGVGTTKPIEKLSVNGTVLAKKVRVSQAAADWPDYVFDSSYQLPSLDEVSLFIKENKHLPDMPSASSIEKDGHDLGDVQKILLKKLEEMTLYMVEQNVLTKKLVERNEKLEQKVKALETIISNNSTNSQTK